MIIKEITPIQQDVLTYLIKLKFQNIDAYDKLILFGLKPNDIRKYIEHPEKCGRWPLDFVYKVDTTINKIHIQYVVNVPQMPEQTEEDRVLSKLLKKNNFLSFGTNTFFNEMVNVNHVILFMERDPIIFEWTSYFISIVNQEVRRVKEKLL